MQVQEQSAFVLNSFVTLVIVVLGVGIIRAEGPLQNPVVAIELDDSLPYGQQPIDYYGEATQNAVARLQARLDRGEVKFSVDEDRGYLPSVLKALEISATSQMLAFSKTALNPKLVSPSNPRAVYFNEECYVAWVPGAVRSKSRRWTRKKAGCFIPSIKRNRPTPPLRLSSGRVNVLPVMRGNPRSACPADWCGDL